MNKFLINIILIIFSLIQIQCQAKEINNTNKAEAQNAQNNNQNKKEGKKEFNLTDSLINFFNEIMDTNKTNSNETKKNIEDKGQKQDQENEHMRIYREQYERRMKEQNERIKKAQEYEIQRQAEIIRIEKEKIEKAKKKEQAERDEFQQKMVDSTFNEIIQIYLEKNEKEYLYFDLDSHQKIVIAFFLNDEEEKINFLFTGPDYRGNNIEFSKFTKKNFLYFEFEAPRKGEYIAELNNRGTKDNDIIFVADERRGKKTDVLKSGNIDKISLLLNNIDNNVNQLRNNKRIEINKINAHNQRVNQNNKSIVFYSILEVVTMIAVFIGQSYYINSIVSNL
jgi:hypothetical protein